MIEVELVLDASALLILLQPLEVSISSERL
jgi:hypothetical protein